MDKEREIQLTEHMGRLIAGWQNEAITKVTVDCVLEMLRKKEGVSYTLSDKEIDYIYEQVKLEVGE